MSVIMTREFQLCFNEMKSNKNISYFAEKTTVVILYYEYKMTIICRSLDPTASIFTSTTRDSLKQLLERTATLQDYCLNTVHITG